MAIKVVGFCGNTQRPSKTRALVEAVSQNLLKRHGIAVDLFDLADTGPSMGLPTELGAIVDAIETADALVVGSPVYKGSYTGLFKHVFDLVRPTALIDRPVLITATGGGARHCLVVEHQLRPLFGFFEACTIPTAIYASEPDFAEGMPANPLVLQRIAAAVDQLAGLIARRSSVAAE